MDDGKLDISSITRFQDFWSVWSLEVRDPKLMDIVSPGAGGPAATGATEEAEDPHFKHT